MSDHDEVETKIKVIDPDMRDTIIKNFSNYKLDGIELLLAEQPGSFMYGDFLINCAMGKQWNDMEIRLLVNGQDNFDKFIEFLTERGYNAHSMMGNHGGRCLYMFFIPSDNPDEDGDPKYPHITMELNDKVYGPNKIAEIVAKFEPENIYYDGKDVYSDIYTGMLQRGTVLINHPEHFPNYMEKYKDRDVNIINDINCDVMVKSTRKQ